MYSNYSLYTYKYEIVVHSYEYTMVTTYDHTESIARVLPTRTREDKCS